MVLKANEGSIEMQNKILDTYMKGVDEYLKKVFPGLDSALKGG